MSACRAVEEQYLAAAERLRLLCYALQLRLVNVVYVEDEETVEPCGGILAPASDFARLRFCLVECRLKSNSRESFFRNLLCLLVVFHSIVVRSIASRQQGIYLCLSVSSYFYCLNDLA